MEGSAWLCVNPVVRKVVGTRRLIYDLSGLREAGAQERTSIFPLLVGGGPVVPMPPRFPVLFF